MFSFNKSKDECTSQSNDTPLSPPIQTTEQKTVNETNFIQTIDKHVELVTATLSELLHSEDDASKKELINWILRLVALIPAKYSPTLHQNAGLVEMIKVWTNCNVIRSLLNLIRVFIMSDNRENIDYILTKLIEHSPKSDWVIAYLITLLPNEQTKISHCIQFLLSSRAMKVSITSILAYLSEHNPQAIVDSSKSDLAFLIHLSTTSKPLLNLLAYEAVNAIDVRMLNNLKLNQDLKKEVIYCIFNAPNSFELLKLLFNVSVHPDANQKVKFQSLAILELITYQLHQIVYCTLDKIQSKPLPLIKELQSNSEELVSTLLVNSNQSVLHKIQIRIINLLCVNYGIEYTTDIIFNFLNTLNAQFDHEFSVENESNNQLLINLLRSLRLPFGPALQNCFNNFIESSAEKQPRFWANLYKILETDSSIKIELDTIADKFAEQLQQKHNNLNSLYYILLIMQSCLEKQPFEASKSNHYLCISLSACLMQIINLLATERKNFKSKIIIVNLIQRCMSILARNHSSNCHIICRALIESEVKPVVEKPEIDCQDQIHVNLLKENSNFNSAFKFRKIPLVANKENSIYSTNLNDSFLRRQIILDTIRMCCSNTSNLLAALLVETLTPDVMFNDKSFPDEDFLKVTIERDLYITRKFESYPILWNLTDLIAKESSLRNCSLLVSALLAVQLTQWASPTANKDKVKFTEKLLKLVSTSEMVPATPFKYLPLVLNHLDSWEIYCMLNDVWRFLKDNYHTNSLNLNSNEQKFQVVKHYFERLRIIGGGKMPGNLYVKIFRSLNKEFVKC